MLFLTFGLTEMEVKMDSLSFFLGLLRLEKRDYALLKLLLSPSNDEEEIAAFFQSIDIDTEDHDRICLIAQLGLQNNYQGVPKSEIPRLRGVTRHTVIRNTQLIMNAIELMKEYQSQGIPVLLCKGIALRLGYLKHQSRHMWDIDLLIPYEACGPAEEIAEKAGYEITHSRHALNLRKKADHNIQIDVHHVFIKTNIKFQSQVESVVWERAKKINAHGVTVCLPSAEDLALQILTNEFSNLVMESNQKSHFKWIYDLSCVLGSTGSFDWNLLFTMARGYKVDGIVRIMLLLLNQVAPSMIDLQTVRGAFPDESSDQKLVSYYKNNIISFQKYAKARKTKKMGRYIWHWLPYTWAVHRYYLYGLSGWEILKRFPENLRIVFGVNSWAEFPLAAINKIKLRRKRDRDEACSESRGINGADKNSEYTGDTAAAGPLFPKGENQF